MDKTLLRNVRREIKNIEKGIGSSPDPDAILNLGNSLRNLLINGLLTQGWNEIKTLSNLPKEPMIKARNLNKVLELAHFQDGRGSFAFAGDVTVANGGRVLGAFATQGAVTTEDLKKQAFAAEPIDFKVPKYRTSACLILRSHVISRENVIKYLANKLGASHYDRTRKLEGKKRAEVEAYLILDSGFDFYGDNPQPHNLAVNFGENGNALHAAILGIRRDLLNSPDIQNLMTIIDANVRPPPNLGFE